MKTFPEFGITYNSLLYVNFKFNVDIFISVGSFWSHLFFRGCAFQKHWSPISGLKSCFQLQEKILNKFSSKFEKEKHCWITLMCKVQSAGFMCKVETGSLTASI